MCSESPSRACSSASDCARGRLLSQSSTRSLIVSRAYVDEGPTLKRFQPRAQGRAYRIRKRTSHITIIVARLSDRVDGD